MPLGLLGGPRAQKATAVAAVTLFVAGCVGLAVTGRPGKKKPVPPAAVRAPITTSAPTTTAAATTTPRPGSSVATPPPATLPPGTPTVTAKLPPTAPRPTVAIPTSIPANCSADVTQALDRFIAQVPDGDAIAFPPQGCYQVEGVILVLHRNNLLFQGNGAQVVAHTDGTNAPQPADPGLAGFDQQWPRARCGFYVENSTNITVQGLSYHGADADGSYHIPFAEQDAFYIAHSNQVLLDQVEADHVYGDFFATYQDATNVTLQNSHFDVSGRNATSVYWGENIVIANNVMGHCHFSNYDVETIRDWTARNLVFTKNDVTGGFTFFSNQGSYGGNGLVGNIQVTYNHLHQLDIGVNVGGGFGDPTNIRDGYTIVGNVGDRPADITVRGEMTFTHANNVVVENNYQPFNSVPGGTPLRAVLLSGSTNVTVSGNWFQGADQLVAPAADRAQLAGTAPAGSDTVSASNSVEDLEAYDLGGEPVMVVTYDGTNLSLGSPLRFTHAANTPLVAQGGTATQSNNSTTATAPAGWSTR